MSADTTTRVPVADVERDGRKEVHVGGRRAVVFHLDGQFVAYLDSCAHLGGPVCSKGSLHPFYTARIQDDGEVKPYFAEGGEYVLACPWHGWEYDLHDGQCLADRTKSLTAVAVEVDGDDLVLTL